MFTHASLISMLLLLLVVVVSGLIVDYRSNRRHNWHPGLWLAVAGVLAACYLIDQAMLPDGHLYGPVVSQGQVRHKIMALTFDDGPNPPFTGQLLAVLAENQVQATFFMTGEHVDMYPDSVRQVQAAGHEIATHSYHHVDMLKLDRTQIAAELAAGCDAIQRVTGTRTSLFRPPHGFRDPHVMEAAQQGQLTVVEWSVIPNDWKTNDAQAIVDRVLQQARNGSIVLLHDGDGNQPLADRSVTVEAVRRLIPLLKARGFELVTVSQLLQHAADRGVINR